jgi:hypothetical protein
MDAEFPWQDLVAGFPKSVWILKSSGRDLISDLSLRNLTAK